jgi:hypothetical protein
MSVNHTAAVCQIRAAIRRQLRADLRLLREMKTDIARLERQIDAERRRLAALNPAL